MAPCGCNSYYFSNFNELSFVIPSFVLTMDTYSQEGMYHSLSPRMLATFLMNWISATNSFTTLTSERSVFMY